MPKSILLVSVLALSVVALTGASPVAQPSAKPGQKVTTSSSSTKKNEVLVGAGSEEVTDPAALKRCAAVLQKGIDRGTRKSGRFLRGGKEPADLAGTLSDSRKVLQAIQACIGRSSCSARTLGMVSSMNCNAKAMLVSLHSEKFDGKTMKAIQRTADREYGDAFYVEAEEEVSTTTTQVCEPSPPPVVPPSELKFGEPGRFFKDNEWFATGEAVEELRALFDARNTAGYNLVSAEIEASSSWVKNTGKAEQLTFLELSQRRAEAVEAVIKSLARDSSTLTSETTFSRSWKGSDGRGVNGPNPYQGEPTPEEIRDHAVGFYKRKPGFAIGSSGDKGLRENQYIRVKLVFEPCYLCAELAAQDCLEFNKTTVAARGEAEWLETELRQDAWRPHWPKIQLKIKKGGGRRFLNRVKVAFRKMGKTKKPKRTLSCAKW